MGSEAVFALGDDFHVEHAVDDQVHGGLDDFEGVRGFVDNEVFGHVLGEQGDAGGKLGATKVMSLLALLLVTLTMATERPMCWPFFGAHAGVVDVFVLAEAFDYHGKLQMPGGAAGDFRNYAARTQHLVQTVDMPNGESVVLGHEIITQHNPPRSQTFG
jgi:hypothetical protein